MWKTVVVCHRCRLGFFPSPIPLPNGVLSSFKHRPTCYSTRTWNDVELIQYSSSLFVCSVCYSRVPYSRVWFSSLQVKKTFFLSYQNQNKRCTRSQRGYYVVSQQIHLETVTAVARPVIRPCDDIIFTVLRRRSKCTPSDQPLRN